MTTVVILPNLSKDDVLRIMRELIADDDGCIVWTNHARDQMFDRGVSNTQVIRCLEKGICTEWPTFITSKGNYKFRVEHTTAGKEIRVAVALSLDEKVIVITVMD